MKNFNKVIVTVDDDKTCFTGLDYEVRRAIDEYIDHQHEYALQLFHQGKVKEARDILKKLNVLMTFKIEYVEEK